MTVPFSRNLNNTALKFLNWNKEALAGFRKLLLFRFHLLPADPPFHFTYKVIYESDVSKVHVMTTMCTSHVDLMESIEIPQHTATEHSPSFFSKKKGLKIKACKGYFTYCIPNGRRYQRLVNELAEGDIGAIEYPHGNKKHIGYAVLESNSSKYRQGKYYSWKGGWRRRRG